MVQRRRVMALLVLSLLVGCGGSDPALPGNGEWRLVNFWAIWCAPCREEIPELNALDRHPGVRVLGVNFDGAEGDTLAAQRAELGIVFDDLSLALGRSLVTRLPAGLPTTLVIDPDDKLVLTLAGPQTEASLMDALVSAGYQRGKKNAGV